MATMGLIPLYLLGLTPTKFIVTKYTHLWEELG